MLRRSSAIYAAPTALCVFGRSQEDLMVGILYTVPRNGGLSMELKMQGTARADKDHRGDIRVNKGGTLGGY